MMMDMFELTSLIYSLFFLLQFCGNIISGISLLSTSVMKLVHIERPEIYATALLPRRSLYIMK